MEREAGSAAGESRPPLPGGWEAEDPLYFTRESQTLSNGDKVVHGQQGEVVGPATLNGYVDQSVAVQFAPATSDSLQTGPEDGSQCVLLWAQQIVLKRVEQAAETS